MKKALITGANKSIGFETTETTDLETKLGRKPSNLAGDIKLLFSADLA